MFCLLLSSCEAQKPTEEKDNCPKPKRVVIFAPTTVSVCHNPESKGHNRICTAECFERGNTTAYCYNLPTDICNEDWEREPWVSAICEELIQSL